jgi:hypothetical protein
MYENRMLRRIYGPMHVDNEGFNDLFSSSNILTVRNGIETRFYSREI